MKICSVGKVLQEIIFEDNIIDDIATRGCLNLAKSQKYVLAYHLSIEIMNRENAMEMFLKMFYLVSNPDSKLSDVSEIFDEREILI